MAFSVIDFQYRVLRAGIQTSRKDLVNLAALVEAIVDDAIAGAIADHERKNDPRTDHEKLLEFAKTDPEIQHCLSQDKWISAIKELRTRGISVIGNVPSLKEAKDVIDQIRAVF